MSARRSVDTCQVVSRCAWGPVGERLPLGSHVPVSRCPRSRGSFTPLLTRGWSHAVKTDGTQTFLTPEGLGGVRHRYATSGSSGPAWRTWGGYPSEPHWRARFSFGTPTTLVAAFTASLISTEPLQRTVQDVPVHTRRALYVATPKASSRTATRLSPRHIPPRSLAAPDDLPKESSSSCTHDSSDPPPLP
ncbi:DUF317 domain-containing protein [Streptomyces sp. NPDC050743]|uniref:DUF317 domain-containing protein n=1 Tax=Streptomyces sp. NPDC050743 TaxID=3365634 RepID=UPI0037A2EBCB